MTDCDVVVFVRHTNEGMFILTWDPEAQTTSYGTFDERNLIGLKRWIHEQSGRGRSVGLKLEPPTSPWVQSMLQVLQEMGRHTIEEWAAIVETKRAQRLQTAVTAMLAEPAPPTPAAPPADAVAPAPDAERPMELSPQ